MFEMAHPRISVTVQFLNKWVHNGLIYWPPNSPILRSLGLSFCGYVKVKLCSSKVTLQQLTLLLPYQELTVYCCFAHTTISDHSQVVTFHYRTKYFSFKMHFEHIAFSSVTTWCACSYILLISTHADYLLPISLL